MVYTLENQLSNCLATLVYPMQVRREHECTRLGRLVPFHRPLVAPLAFTPSSFLLRIMVVLNTVMVHFEQHKPMLIFPHGGPKETTLVWLLGVEAMTLCHIVSLSRWHHFFLCLVSAGILAGPSSWDPGEWTVN